MTVNLQLGPVDIVILLILAAVMVFAVKIVIGFFKGGKK